MLEVTGGLTTATEPILSDEVLGRLGQISAADVLVGIPSFHSAETIGNVITAVETGLRKQFPDARAVICVSDGGSTDGTLEAAAEAGVGDQAEFLLVPAESRPPMKVLFPYRGTSGKGSAFRSIFEVAAHLGPRACAVVDSDLRSITPYWLDRLLGPVMHHGYDFVAPVYTRHKFDGTITNSFAYPLTAALYGARLRQPIGGEFGFSGDLAKAYAAEDDVWESDVARFGIDIWMTTFAIVKGFRTCQAILGAKIHDPKDPGKDLGPMFTQVVGSLFALAGRYEERWDAVTHAEAPPTFGFRAAYSADPITVSVPRLTWRFVEGYVRHNPLWREVLTPDAMTGVERAVGEAAESTRGLVIDAELWTQIVYDFLVAYNARPEQSDALLDSLIPLYFARTATFVQDVWEATAEEAEERIEEQVDIAVAMKDHLRARWREAGIAPRGLLDQRVPAAAHLPDGHRDAISPSEP